MKAEDIITKCKALVADSKLYDELVHQEGNYEWEMGRSVVGALLPENHNILSELLELGFMGIPVRGNYVNPDCLKLWREIK